MIHAAVVIPALGPEESLIPYVASLGAALNELNRRYRPACFLSSCYPYRIRQNRSGAQGSFRSSQFITGGETICFAELAEQRSETDQSFVPNAAPHNKMSLHRPTPTQEIIFLRSIS